MSRGWPRDAGQPQEAQLSDTAPMLQLREESKCLRPVAHRVLAEIKATTEGIVGHDDNII